MYVCRYNKAIMARLPNPGSDDGTWGAILNDFLQQSLDTAGALKANTVNTTQLVNSAVTTTKIADTNVTNAKLADNSVSTAKLQNSAVSTAKLADGSVTAAKLASGATRADSLHSLLVFYANPNIINARYDNDYAAGILARYDDVVLGSGLEDPGHVDYANTTAIIQKTLALSPETVIWGYIDTGVSTGNLSLATLQTQIDQWVAIGAKGIFCDVIGYAYGVSRARQNSIISYIHSKGVGAFLNVFNPDEVLSSAVDATYNPAGTATVANSSDILMLESWVANTDAYTAPYYATFSDIKTRADKARTYRASLGIRIYSVNIVQHTGRTEQDMEAFRGICEAYARAFRLDGDGMAASSYSSTGVDVGVVAPRFPLLRASPARPTAPYVLNGPWSEIQAPDLGLIINNTARTWDQR